MPQSGSAMQRLKNQKHDINNLRAIQEDEMDKVNESFDNSRSYLNPQKYINSDNNREQEDDASPNSLNSKGSNLVPNSSIHGNKSSNSNQSNASVSIKEYKVSPQEEAITSATKDRANLNQVEENFSPQRSFNSSPFFNRLSILKEPTFERNANALKSEPIDFTQLKDKYV